MDMKGLQLHGLWLVLQIISTTQERVTYSNMNSGVTSEIMLLPTPSISKYFGKQTLLVRKSPIRVIESRSTNVFNVQSSAISTSGTLTSVFTPEHTQSVGIFNNNTQSVRNLFKNTQTWSADSQTISSTINIPMRANTSNVGTKISEYPSTVDSLQSNIVQNATGVSYRYSSANISKTRARILSTVHTLNTTFLQSNVLMPQSSNVALYITTDDYQVRFTVSSLRSESSSNYRFPSSESTTQTPQLSRMINVSMSPPNVSVSEILNTRFSGTSSYANENQSSHAHKSSTFKDFKTSKILAYIASTYGSSQFNRHGSSSYRTNTRYLSVTRTANNDSRVRQTTVVTEVQSISQTSLNKESINTQSLKTILETVRISTSSRLDTYSTAGTRVATELRTYISSSILATKASVNHSRIKSSEVTHNKSQVILPSATTRPPYTEHPSGRRPSIPLYVLAICLPLAALLGFILAFVYFKRNKKEQRVRYSVTVEISAEKPDYELQRMYSIIDMSSGINDFLSGLDSTKASNELLDQLDGIPVDITKPDQTV